MAGGGRWLPMRLSLLIKYFFKELSGKTRALIMTALLIRQLVSATQA